jgi:hypothetical protein
MSSEGRVASSTFSVPDRCQPRANRSLNQTNVRMCLDCRTTVLKYQGRSIIEHMYY